MPQISFLLQHISRKGRTPYPPPGVFKIFLSGRLMSDAIRLWFQKVPKVPQKYGQRRQRESTLAITSTALTRAVLFLLDDLLLFLVSRGDSFLSGLFCFQRIIKMVYMHHHVFPSRSFFFLRSCRTCPWLHHQHHRQWMLLRHRRRRRHHRHRHRRQRTCQSQWKWARWPQKVLYEWLMNLIQLMFSLNMRFF